MLHLEIILFLFMASFTSASDFNQHFPNWSIRSKFNSSNPCGTSPLLSIEQKRICTVDQRIRESLIAGGNSTIRLSAILRNVSSAPYKISTMSPYTLWLKDAGSKEAAFIASLRSAIYAIELANYCLKNESSCNCSSNGKKLREYGRRYCWKWQECPDRVKDAVHLSHEWTKNDTLPEGPFRILALHNADIGLRAVKNLTEKSYLCRGGENDNGSCYYGQVTLRMPSLEEIAEKLYKLYKKAVFVIFQRNSYKFQNTSSAKVNNALIYAR